MDPVVPVIQTIDSSIGPDPLVATALKFSESGHENDRQRAEIVQSVSLAIEDGHREGQRLQVRLERHVLVRGD